MIGCLFLGTLFWVIKQNNSMKHAENLNLPSPPTHRAEEVVGTVGHPQMTIFSMTKTWSNSLKTETLNVSSSQYN